MDIFCYHNFFLLFTRISVLEVKLSAEWTIYQVISMVMLSFLIQSGRRCTVSSIYRLMTGKKEMSDLTPKQGTFTWKEPLTMKFLYLPIKIRQPLYTILSILVIIKTRIFCFYWGALGASIGTINPVAAYNTHQTSAGKQKAHYAPIHINCLAQHFSVTCCRRSRRMDCGRTGIFIPFSELWIKSNTLWIQDWGVLLAFPDAWGVPDSSWYWAVLSREHTSHPFSSPLGPGGVGTSRNLYKTRKAILWTACICVLKIMKLFPCCTALNSFLESIFSAVGASWLVHRNGTVQRKMLNVKVCIWVHSVWSKTRPSSKRHHQTVMFCRYNLLGFKNLSINFSIWPCNAPDGFMSFLNCFRHFPW